MDPYQFPYQNLDRILDQNPYQILDQNPYQIIDQNPYHSFLKKKKYCRASHIALPSYVLPLRDMLTSYVRGIGLADLRDTLSNLLPCTSDRRARHQESSRAVLRLYFSLGNWLRSLINSRQSTLFILKSFLKFDLWVICGSLPNSLPNSLPKS